MLIIIETFFVLLNIFYKQIFDTTLAWLQHDWDNRKEYAAPLLQEMRLGLLPIGYLSMTLIKMPDLCAIPECKQLIGKVLELYDARDDEPLYCTHPEIFASRTSVKVRSIYGFVSHFV